MITTLLVTFAIALAASLVVVPVLKLIAVPIGLIDHPDKRRKLQNRPIPLVGGIALFLVTVIVSCCVMAWNGLLLIGQPAERLELVGLVIASVLLMLVGIADDRFGLRGRQKLFGQIVAASILIAFGFSFDSTVIYGYRIHFGHFALLIMYAWILGCINSVNLLDGADGFATSLGILIAGGLCVISFFSGHHQDAIITGAMCGALVGFLRFNFPPASAYLGDAGSMLIGMLVAAIAIRSATKEPMAYALFAPIALLAIPLIDTGAAIIRRRLTGKSIYSTDRGHLHHTLIRKGLSPRLALLWFVLLCSTTVIGATFSSIYRQSEYAFISIAAVLCCLIGFKYFGFLEFKLLSDKAKHVGKSFFVFGKTKKESKERQVKIRLQGNRNWEYVWSSTTEFAKKYDLNEIVLDLDLPWIHESFHATYHGSTNHGEDNEWTAEIPLQSTDRIIGRILLKANVHLAPTSEILPKFLDMLTDLEPYLLATIETKDKLPSSDGRNGKPVQAASLSASTIDEDASSNQVSDHADSFDVRV